MAETASAESDGARVRGSIARRMLVAAAIWSAVVLLIAGWSLQAFYRTETDQQLDLSLDDTLRTLAGAVNSEQGQITVDDAKLPRDERFSLPLLGRYWAFIDLSAENEVVRTRKSLSFFDEDAGVAADVRAEALKQKGAVLHLDAPGPDDKQMRLGLQAVTFPDRPEPLLLYAAIDRTSADASVGSFTLRLGIALCRETASALLHDRQQAQQVRHSQR